MTLYKLLRKEQDHKPLSKPVAHEKEEQHEPNLTHEENRLCGSQCLV